MEGTNKRRNLGIGKLAQQAIRSGMTNEETLLAVLAAFPDARTTVGCIRWYRNRMRKRGEDVPTSREVVANRRALLKQKKPSIPLAQAA
jgi:hypothetical protein